MLRKNLGHIIRSMPFLIITLIATMAAIFCVIYTAFGTIASLSQFMTDYQNVRYLAFPRGDLLSSDLITRNVEGINEKIFAVSHADQSSGAVVVGTFGADQWMPQNEMDFYTGDRTAFENLSTKRNAAYVNSIFYHLYERIDPWIDTIVIGDTSFEVAGMADFYFSETGYSRLIESAQSDAVRVTLPPAMDSYGNEIFFPDALGSVVLSGGNFAELDLPVSYISVVFERPPTEVQYEQMRASFDARFEVEAYRSGSSDLTLAHINAFICGVALLLAIILISGLIQFFLDANQDVYRSLYIIGCTQSRLLSGIVFQLAIFYAVAAVISAIPCYYFLEALTALNISVAVGINAFIPLILLSILFALIATLPACIAAVKRYTRGEGVHVQA